MTDTQTLIDKISAIIDANYFMPNELEVLADARAALLAGEKRWRDISEEVPEEGQEIEAVIGFDHYTDETKVMSGYAMKAESGKWFLCNDDVPARRGMRNQFQSRFRVWRPASGGAK